MGGGRATAVHVPPVEPLEAPEKPIQAMISTACRNGGNAGNFTIWGEAAIVQSSKRQTIPSTS